MPCHFAGSLESPKTASMIEFDSVIVPVMVSAGVAGFVVCEKAVLTAMAKLTSPRALPKVFIAPSPLSADP